MSMAVVRKESHEELRQWPLEDNEGSGFPALASMCWSYRHVLRVFEFLHRFWEPIYVLTLAWQPLCHLRYLLSVRLLKIHNFDL